MKKIFAILVATACCMSMWAEDFSVSGIYYNILTGKTNEVEVTYRDMFSSSYSNEYTGSVTIPSTVTYNGITYSVTSIGDEAFHSCDKLTAVTIGNNVTSIGKSAFEYCHGLTSVTIPNSVRNIEDYAFHYSGLTEMTIPNGVQSIGEYAFAWCQNLASITIPNSVTSVGYAAFAGNAVLTSVTIDTNIGNDMFASCSALKHVTIGNNVTNIGEKAFFLCSNLMSVEIPNSITSIGKYAFSYCSSLTEVVIPKSVTTMGNHAFSYCSSLTKAIAPAEFFNISEDAWIGSTKSFQHVEVTSGELTDNAFGFINRSYKTLNVLNLAATSNEVLAEEAFKGCYMLDSLYLPENLVEIPYMAVAECKNLKSISIPATVEEIAASAFENCRKLKEVHFDEDGALTVIGDWAFYNCHNLQKLTIPEGVTKVGDEAFFDCTYLKELTLPSTLAEAADNSFALCSKLKQIQVNATRPPLIEARTFEEVDRSIPVYVPDEAVVAYEDDIYWKEFNIQGKSNLPSDVDHVEADNNNNIQKMVSNGQLIIIRDGKYYTVMGQEVK